MIFNEKKKKNILVSSLENCNDQKLLRYAHIFKSYKLFELFKLSLRQKLAWYVIGLLALYTNYFILQPAARKDFRLRMNYEPKIVNIAQDLTGLEKNNLKTRSISRHCFASTTSSFKFQPLIPQRNLSTPESATVFRVSKVRLDSQRNQVAKQMHRTLDAVKNRDAFEIANPTTSMQVNCINNYLNNKSGILLNPEKEIINTPDLVSKAQKLYKQHYGSEVEINSKVFFDYLSEYVDHTISKTVTQFRKFGGINNQNTAAPEVTTQVSTATTEGTTQVSTATTEGTTQVSTATTEGTTQVSTTSSISEKDLKKADQIAMVTLLNLMPTEKVPEVEVLLPELRKAMIQHELKQISPEEYNRVYSEIQQKLLSIPFEKFNVPCSEHFSESVKSKGVYAYVFKQAAFGLYPNYYPEWGIAFQMQDAHFYAAKADGPERKFNLATMSDANHTLCTEIESMVSPETAPINGGVTSLKSLLNRNRATKSSQESTLDAKHELSVMFSKVDSLRRRGVKLSITSHEFDHRDYLNHTMKFINDCAKCTETINSLQAKDQLDQIVIAATDKCGNELFGHVGAAVKSINTQDPREILKAYYETSKLASAELQAIYHKRFENNLTSKHTPPTSSK